MSGLATTLPGKGYVFLSVGGRGGVGGAWGVKTPHHKAVLPQSHVHKVFCKGKNETKPYIQNDYICEITR